MHDANYTEASFMQMLLAWCIYHTSKTLAEMRPELTAVEAAAEIAERGFPTLSDRLNQARYERAISTNVPTRLQPDPVMDFTDRCRRRHIGFIKSPIEDDAPVFDLHRFDVRHLFAAQGRQPRSGGAERASLRGWRRSGPMAPSR